MKTMTRALLVAVVLAAGPRAEAQQAVSQPPKVERRVDFDRAIQTAAGEVRLLAPPSARTAQADQASGSRRGAGKRILGGLVGGTAGFFAGGYIGAAIDGDCGGCDDPGLKGALIGMPIGAAIGAWAGQRWLF